MGLKTNKTTKTSRLDCQFIESFPVSDGSRKLLTLSEKQNYIDERLKSYDKKKLGTAVYLEISPEGISMLQVGAKTVTMAHPLQRISYATAETSNKLFAYVSQPPGAAGTEMVCHTFLTKKKDHAVEMSAILGKLLKQTSSYSLEEGDKLEEAAQKRGTGRQWAKKQVADGHRNLPKNTERKQQSFEVDEPRKENPSTLPETSSVQNPPEASSMTSPSRNNNVGEASFQPITSPQDSIAPSSPEASSLGSPSSTNHMNEASSQPITQVQSSSTEASSPGSPSSTNHMNEASSQPITQVQSGSTEASAQSFPLETVYENVAPPLPPKAIKHRGMSKVPSFPEACSPTSPSQTDFPEPTIQPAQSYVPNSSEASSLSSPLGTTTCSPTSPLQTDFPEPTTQPAPPYAPRFPEASNQPYPVRTGHANEGPSFYPQPTTQPAPPYGPRFPGASNPPYPVSTGYANEIPSFYPQPTTQPARPYGPRFPEASNPPYPVRTGHANVIPSFPPQSTTQPPPLYRPRFPEASNPPYMVRTGHANQVRSFAPQPTSQSGWSYVPTSPEARNPHYPFGTNQMIVPPVLPRPTTLPPGSPFPPFGTNQMNVRPVLPKPTTLPPSSNVPTSPRKDNLLMRSESNPTRMFPGHGFSPNPVGNTTNPSESHRLHRINSAPSDMLFSSVNSYQPRGNPRRSSDSFPQQVSPNRQVITAQAPGPINQDWYMPEASSDMAANMLAKMKLGSFVVRNSQSRPGCHALTMKVSQGPNQSGIVNYVIVPVKNGFVLEGSEKKVFKDISTLIQYHVSHKDGLFSRLVLTRPQSSLPQQQRQHGGARR